MNRKVSGVGFLGLILCLIGFPQLSETLFTPSLPDLARSFNVGIGVAENTLSVYFMGFAFGVLGFGILADKVGRRNSMILGIFVYFLGTLGCLLCNSIENLFLFRFIQAFGASCGSVVTQTMIRDRYQGRERKKRR